MFFNVFLICLFLSTRVTSSALRSTNTTNSESWEITALHTYIPNGWPGSAPYSMFFVSITNLTLSPTLNLIGGILILTLDGQMQHQVDQIFRRGPF